MIEEKEFVADHSLEIIDNTENRFIFKATSLDNNFECEKGRAVLSKKSVGKHYIWRHQHPIQKGNTEMHVFGEVLESKINEKGFIESVYEVYGHTEEHLKLRDDIRERDKVGKPLGISMRYRKYFIGDKILHYDVFEHSGTPFPKCEKCKTIEYIGEKQVPEKEKKDETKEGEAELDLNASLKKIEELEAHLNSRSEVLEGFKTKVETLEKELEDKNGKLEETEKAEKTLEEQLVDMKLEIEFLKKKPLIDKILEVRKLDEKELEFYKLQDKKYLDEKFEQFSKESESKIIVTSQEESAEKAMEKTDEEFEDKVPTMEKFTKQLIKKPKKEEKEDK